MEQRTYVVAIGDDEQYRTHDRFGAKVFYNLIDEKFEQSVDGQRKQLIQVEADGWNSRVLLEDVIHCPQEELDEEKEEEQEEEQPTRRGWHR